VFVAPNGFSQRKKPKSTPRIGRTSEGPRPEAVVLEKNNFAGSYYAAIIRLDGPNDLPPTNPDGLVVPPDELLSTTVFVPPVSSTEFFHVVPMNVTLDIGWHAVIFGTNQFGALNGDGGMGKTHFQNNETSIIGWAGGAPFNGQWIDLPTDGVRFVVEGVLVPEPASWCFFLVASTAILRRRNRSHRVFG